jgi:hypothetical protein
MADGAPPAAPATPFVTRSMDDERVAMADDVPPPPFGSAPSVEMPPSPPIESLPVEPASVDAPPPAVEARSGPGAAHIPVFREASPHAAVDDPRKAGISRENRDAVEAPRPDAPPREDG